MRTLLLLAAVVILLYACETFGAPHDCGWQYTKLGMRTDTVWNTVGPGFWLVTRQMPTDSVWVCP